MAMLGAGNIPERIRPVQPPVAEPRAPKVKTPTPPVVPHDQVTLSAKAKEVQNLAKQVQATPEVRPQAVQAAKNNPANISAAKIAEKLLLEH